MAHATAIEGRREPHGDAPISGARHAIRPSAGPSEPPAESIEPITILMVDDEPVCLRTAEWMLSTAKDIRLHICGDAAEALAFAALLRPTLILQDVVMPGVDGMELVRGYRGHPATRDVPVLMLSSEEDPTIKAAAFAEGADDYMVKFPDPLELLTRLRYHARIYRRRLAREQAAAEAEARERALVADRSFVRETFGRYLSESIVARLLESPEGLELGGAEQHVTIMMTDLRGFTSLSERLPPARVVALINIYLGVMTDIILRHGGTVDEFIGDAILALFGAPNARPDDAARAVRCAVEMQDAMAEVNARGHAEGLPEVEMGIGVHTGDVVVGNIGCYRRAKFAVVGAAVNLAARIESYTLGGQILISQATLDEAGGDVIRGDHLDVTPKGVRQPLRIHQVTGWRGDDEIRLGATTAQLTRPRAALRACYTVVDGKDASGPIAEGEVLGLGPRAARIRGPIAVAVMTNVLMGLARPDGSALADDVYAKVTEVEPDGTFTVRFTSVPTAAATWLEGGSWTL